MQISTYLLYNLGKNLQLTRKANDIIKLQSIFAKIKLDAKHLKVWDFISACEYIIPIFSSELSIFASYSGFRFPSMREVDTLK